MDAFGCGHVILCVDGVWVRDHQRNRHKVQGRQNAPQHHASLSLSCTHTHTYVHLYTQMHIHTQVSRDETIQCFRYGVTPVMVATGIASRGLDVPDIAHVVNFDMPFDIHEYVYR